MVMARAWWLWKYITANARDAELPRAVVGRKRLQLRPSRIGPRRVRRVTSSGPSTVTEQLAVLAVTTPPWIRYRRAVLFHADSVGCRLEQQQRGVSEELGTERRTASRRRTVAVSDRSHRGPAARGRVASRSFGAHGDVPVPAGMPGIGAASTPPCPKAPQLGALARREGSSWRRPCAMGVLDRRGPGQVVSSHYLVVCSHLAGRRRGAPAACGQCGLDSSIAGEHPVRARARPASSMHVSPELVTVPSLDFSRRRAGRRTPRPGAGGYHGPGRRPAIAAGGRIPRRRGLATDAASTSSKTNVGTGAGAGRATSSASMTRDSSPPEAPLPSGRGPSGVGAAQQQLAPRRRQSAGRSAATGTDRSGRRPRSVRAVARARYPGDLAIRAGCGMASSVQLGGDLVGEPPGGARPGPPDSSRPGRRARRAACCARRAARSIPSSVPSSSSRPLSGGASTRPAPRRSCSPYLRVSAVSAATALGDPASEPGRSRAARRRRRRRRRGRTSR
jgi:hypothetical protein